MDSPELLTAAEVAARFRVTKGTVSRWAKNGDLTPVRLGMRTIRFRRSDVERLIQGAA